ncbi:DUF2877 domain-containing protein [Phycicoccus sp. HDW14]|uniref:oxamate carbamoyltransferase subunit AllH family protein n=1 Tax=Phycicoccus sp. HDW14 TaxID=2714941 RepID=UPI00140BE972|nr:DUF2877 domain-containing protein [Phycicoccus sp. HDW14]QIM21571.1 DUF2877 domain-containing protein [Phycicoccus sp. HDW14]
MHRAGAYLAAADRVLPVLGHDALALPGAVRLGEPCDRLELGVVAGDVVVVGAGTLAFPALTVRGVRTWRPARVARGAVAHAATGPVRSALAGGCPAAPDWLAPAVVEALTATAPEQAVGRLVGRGPGLTPSGDDALAGALLVRRALGHVPPRGRPDPLAAAVRARLHATTAVSASLLAAALDGWATPEVVALVDAVAAGDLAATRAALPPVLAVGHTSGADLVAGLGAALDPLAATGRTAA